jgi:hypothetical protein
MKLNGRENIYGCYKWVKSYWHILNFRIGLKANLTISFTSHLRHAFSRCIFTVRFYRAFLHCNLAIHLHHEFVVGISTVLPCRVFLIYISTVRFAVRFCCAFLLCIFALRFYNDFTQFIGLSNLYKRILDSYCF